MSNHIQRIAQLNDLARTAMGVASRVIQTEGILALPPADQLAIRESVERFNAFNPANDPHGEHDFGGFEHAGNRIFWKIDYYDRRLSSAASIPKTRARQRGC